MEKQRKLPELKPLFKERMQQLLSDKDDFQKYLDILKILPVKSLRCNTLKISPEQLKKRLQDKGWQVHQLWGDFPEIMIIENNLEPGELGRALEHLLGYYYIQELASMLPVLALKPKEDEIILDLCSAPGSKTTQMSSQMNNTGTIIANEVSLGRIKILSSNLERCGVINTIITKKEGVSLCNKLKKQNIQFDRILVDAPCSGEGTLRSSPKTYVMWNIKTVNKLSKIQRQLFSAAFELLKVGGEIIYSTCTHAPEENEEIVDFILDNFKNKIKILPVNLPKELNPRPGVLNWQDKNYNKDVKLSVRIYPHDSNTEGFFIAKFKKIKD